MQTNFFTNVDYKAFTTILAECMKKYISKITHKGETGCILKRKIKDKNRVYNKGI